MDFYLEIYLKLIHNCLSEVPQKTAHEKSKSLFFFGLQTRHYSLIQSKIKQTRVENVQQMCQLQTQTINNTLYTVFSQAVITFDWQCRLRKYIFYIKKM